MGITELLLLAVALSIDAFGIGASCGFGEIVIAKLPRIVIFSVSICVTVVSVIIGKALGGVISDVQGRIIGAAILILIGCFMTAGAVKKMKISKNNADTCENEKPESQCVPSESIDCGKAAGIGLAISADAFAAGLSAGIGSENAMVVPLLCGVFQIAFFFGGERIARRIKKRVGDCKGILGAAAGLLLVGAGAVRLFV